MVGAPTISFALCDNNSWLHQRQTHMMHLTYNTRRRKVLVTMRVLRYVSIHDPIKFFLDEPERIPGENDAITCV